MAKMPERPQLFHITHESNLSGIIKRGGLLSDQNIASIGGPSAAIGMSTIKRRRLQLPVDCHTGKCVGEFVPFYFCPRSIMLYLLMRGNHPELHYHGGQESIVHLVADLYEVVDWADKRKVPWAFTLSNAGAYYAAFRNDLSHLSDLNWNAIYARDFRDPDIKEGKQAEFLIYCEFPWHLIRRIGVQNTNVKSRVDVTLQESTHQPTVYVHRDWYF